MNYTFVWTAKKVDESMNTYAKPGAMVVVSMFLSNIERDLDCWKEHFNDIQTAIFIDYIQFRRDQIVLNFPNTGFYILYTFIISHLQFHLINCHSLTLLSDYFHLHVEYLPIVELR